MKQLLNFFRDQYDGFFKLFIFIAAIVVIVFIFPKEAKFKYEFQKGKPWGHSDLIATFDFPIYKPAEKLAKEREELEQNKKLYFKVDTAVVDKVTKKISEQLSQEFEKGEFAFNSKELFLNQLKAIQEEVSTIYKKGVVQLTPSIDNKPEDYSIELIEGNLVSSKELRELFTARTAYAAFDERLNELEKSFKSAALLYFEEVLEQNIFFDEATTNQIYQESIQKISLTEGLVVRGESVISKGEIVDGKKLQMIQSLKMEFENQVGGGNQFYYILFGQVLLVALVLLLLALYLFLFRKKIISSDLQLSFLLLLIVLFVLGAEVSLSIDVFSIYLVPFCMLPIIVRTFFDTRTALFTHLVTILIVGFIAPNPYEFILIEMLTGIVTIFSVLSLKNRSQLFISSAIIFAIYSVCFFGISIVQEGDIATINYNAIAWFLGSAMLTLFAYPLIYVFEKLFGFVSEVTLLETADTNNKLLRQLNLKAPGTFQHSLQVANLAEEAIRAIGGNSLLVRVGALYHDIGKMNAPMYFIENQATHINPHDELSPEESVQIIINHVKDGIKIAKKYKLPDIIIDFIRTHHGTSKVRFFLMNYKDQNPDIEINEDDFRYPGPIPYSKETSVLMMADSVEAASRSLKVYDTESIEKLVDGIIQNQIDEGQYANADITFKDISTIKKMFKKKLMNIYHVRIAYPDPD
jgi:hypothetical protein